MCACAFHNYHVMTELSCGVLNSPCTLAHLYCIVSTQRRLEVWLDHVVAQRAARAACTGMSIISA